MSKKWLKLINASEQLPCWVEPICLPWQWAFSEYMYVCTYMCVERALGTRFQDTLHSKCMQYAQPVSKKIVWRLYEAWQQTPAHHVSPVWKTHEKRTGPRSQELKKETHTHTDKHKMRRGERLWASMGKVTTMANKFAAFPRTCIGCFLHVGFVVMTSAVFSLGKLL